MPNKKTRPRRVPTKHCGALGVGGKKYWNDIPVLSPLHYESCKAERTQGPRRGRICLTAGLDLRKSVTMQGATSKMSHNRTVILVVRPLWGRSNEDDLPPQVKTCGYANETPLGSFLHLSLCPLGFLSPLRSESATLRDVERPLSFSISFFLRFSSKAA